MPNLLVRIHLDVAFAALLCEIGPRIARHPFAQALSALVFAEAPFLALVRCFAFDAWTCLHKEKEKKNDIKSVNCSSSEIDQYSRVGNREWNGLWGNTSGTCSSRVVVPSWCVASGVMAVERSPLSCPTSGWSMPNARMALRRWPDQMDKYPVPQIAGTIPECQSLYSGWLDWPLPALASTKKKYSMRVEKGRTTRMISNLCKGTQISTNEQHEIN